MGRAYTAATAALALDTSAKWLDNTLSHNHVAGVRQEKQGIARRLAIDGLVILGLALRLTKDLGIPLRAAIAIAEKIASAKGQYTSPRGVSINVDLDGFQHELLKRLDQAVEVAPLPRRGRPPKNKTGRLD